MGHRPRLTDPNAARARIVACLWPDTRQGQAIVLGPEVDGDPRWRGPGTPLRERELAAALRSASPPAIAVLRSASPTVLRAVREAPPALLVWLGPDDDAVVPELVRAGIRVLGPDAWMHVGVAASEGTVIACGHRGDELGGLVRALGPERVAVAMAPTPAWLPWWIEEPRLSGLAVAGYVDAANLDVTWARFARRSDVHVLVPVGVRTLDLEDTDTSRWSSALAAHALERRTGPVFPSARVVALVLANLRHEDRARASDPPAHELAVWNQARRAVPILGATIGMETPRPGLSLAAPTAAFLAQAALLRAETSALLRRDPPAAPPPPEPEGHARALEVLASADERLTDQESKVVLRGFGFDVTRQAVASSASGAAGFAERIGYPVVLKALSPDLRRRSDVGGVMLSLETAAAVRRAYATIVNNIEREAPTARLDGVLVAEMIPHGPDVRCGGRRLETGEVALYGQVQGGTTPLEAVLGLWPMTPEEAVELAQAVLARALVPALRRWSDPDVHGLALLFLRLGQVFEHTGERVLAVDLGPVRFVAGERGYVTLDATIVQRPHLEGT